MRDTDLQRRLDAPQMVVGLTAQLGQAPVVQRRELVTNNHRATRIAPFSRLGRASGRFDASRRRGRQSMLHNRWLPETCRHRS
jgi:hypothetical protein